MNNQIKEIIVKEFQELEGHYEYKVKDYNRYIKHLEDSLIEDEKETDINNKYSNEDIEHIKDVIKGKEGELIEYENKLKDCRRVLNYFKEDYVNVVK